MCIRDSYNPVKQDGGWQRFDVQTTYGTVELWAHATATPRSPKPPTARPQVDISRPPTGALGSRSVAEIRRVVTTRRGLLRACYQRQLNETSGLTGDVVVKISIARDGKVAHAAADAARTTLASERVVQCVVET